MQRAVQVDCQHVAAQIATGREWGEELEESQLRASKSIIFVLTEADQKVAAESIMQIMMPLAGPADVRAGNRGMQTVRQTDRTQTQNAVSVGAAAAAQLATC